MTREEIARVIDPDAWRKVDRLRRNADTSDQTSEKVRGIWRNEATDLAKSSLAKADAILAKFHQDAGSGELVEKLAAHIWTNIAGHPGAPAFAHEYGWSEEWPSDGELVRDLVRTIAKSALSYRAADALERGSQVGAMPPVQWISEQAKSLSSAKDEDSVGALAWNLRVAFQRWADASRSQVGDGPRWCGPVDGLKEWTVGMETEGRLAGEFAALLVFNSHRDVSAFGRFLAESGAMYAAAPAHGGSDADPT